jgi:hypothetical protein
MPTTPGGQKPPGPTIEQQLVRLDERRQEILQRIVDNQAKKPGAGISVTDQRDLDEIDQQRNRLMDEQSMTGEELDQRDREAAGTLTGDELDARDRERTMTGEELDAWDRQRKQATESDEISMAEPGGSGTGDSGGSGSGDGGGTGDSGGAGSGGGTGDGGSGGGTGGDGGGGSGGDATSEGADDNPHGISEPASGQRLSAPGLDAAHPPVGDGVTDPAAEGGLDDNPIKSGNAVRTSGQSVAGRVSVPNHADVVHPHSDPRVTDPVEEG